MAIQLGDIAPDFEAETTEGKIRFHEWIGDKWCLLMSHPKDFTPVCTTELGYVAKIKAELEKRNCKAIAVSVDDVKSHKGWIGDIEETQHAKMILPAHRRSGPESLEPLRHDPPQGERHPHGALGLLHRPEQEGAGDDHLPGEHGAQLRRDPPRPRLAPADRQVPGGHPGQLEAGR